MIFFINEYLDITLFDHPVFEPGTFGVAGDSRNFRTTWSVNEYYKIYRIKSAGTV